MATTFDEAAKYIKQVDVATYDVAPGLVPNMRVCLCVDGVNL
jgi:hypothetical protein